LKGAAGIAGAAAAGLMLPGGFASAQGALKPGTGDLTVGSNYSNDLPKQGFHAALDAFPNKNVTIKLNEVDHNTYQQNITTYLQNPDDVMCWFAGYRMRYFAAQGLVGDISDVWDAGLSSVQTEGFKGASTGDDGKLHFVPWLYYAWGIHYKPSVFQANGWEVPTTWDALLSLADNMKTKGITPFALGNDGRWPAMGTFDQLNFRLNGYQFHVDLMAGKEKWTDDRVKNVFTQWQTLLPYHQDNPNGRKWEEAGSAFANGECGMMTIGNFVAIQFPNGDTSDLDFFPWPSMNDEFGADTVEAPIDGFMMAAKPKNGDAAKELLGFLGTKDAQAAYLAKDSSVIGAATDMDQAGYNSLQKKAIAAVGAAAHVTQFLDRDTSPEFAENVAGPGLADFLSDPSKIDSVLDDMQSQAEAIFTS